MMILTTARFRPDVTSHHETNAEWIKDIPYDKHQACNEKPTEPNVADLTGGDVGHSFVAVLPPKVERGTWFKPRHSTV